MKKLVTICAVVLVVLAVSSVVQASTVVDFTGVALRPANDGTSGYGTITENVAQDGAAVSTSFAGQKVYYGTDFFNGTLLSNMSYIQYTYKISSANNPYINLAITDGLGHYAVMAALNATKTGVIGDLTAETVKTTFAGACAVYESSDTSVLANGARANWADVSGWSLLAIGGTRVLNSTELQFGLPQARGPVTDGLAILWGDSLGNYMGNKDIWGVSVGANGAEYVAGVPEPMTLALLGLGGLLLRRKK
jgi:hypothetical protein